MPIEIKELHIRVAVNATQSGQPTNTLSSADDGNLGGSNVKDAIVAECVEQVLHILQSKTER
jgi:hypothetical protein